MTTEELAAIEARANAATAGPWVIHWSHSTPSYPLSVAVINHEKYARYYPKCGSALWHDQIVGGWCAKADDMRFIAHARTDIPRLLAHVAALQRERDFLKSKGLTVGILKDQNGENLAYIIEPESELCDLATLRKLTDADIRAVKAERERDEALAAADRLEELYRKMRCNFANTDDDYNRPTGWRTKFDATTEAAITKARNA